MRESGQYGVRMHMTPHRILALVSLVASALLTLLALVPIASARPVAGAPECTILPVASPWNQRIDRLPVAAGSAALIAGTGIQRLHADFSDADADGYGIPINVVDASTPRSTPMFEYDDESDHGTYPIPTSPLIEAGGDRHILMLERDTCRLSELYGAVRSMNMWHAGSGAQWDLRSLALRPEGWTSADAAGLPILPGLARHEELAAGGIDHALRITLPISQRAYLWPARHFASSERSPARAPMGMRLRVRAGFDTSRFGPQTRAILEAGKQYGYIVADNGSAGFISGAPASGWDDDDLHDLGQISPAALEVVDTSTLRGTPTARRAWNLRWTVVPRTRLLRASAYVTKSGYVTVTASQHGRVVAHKRVFVRQGYVRIDLAKIAGARYTLALH